MSYLQGVDWGGIVMRNGDNKEHLSCILLLPRNLDVALPQAIQVELCCPLGTLDLQCVLLPRLELLIELQLFQ